MDTHFVSLVFHIQLKINITIYETWINELTVHISARIIQQLTAEKGNIFLLLIFPHWLWSNYRGCEDAV